MKQLNLSNDLDKEIFSLNDKDSQMKIISNLLNYFLIIIKVEKIIFKILLKVLINNYKFYILILIKVIIWNLCVYYRIEKFGKKLIIGDSWYEEKKIKKKIWIMRMKKIMKIKILKIIIMKIKILELKTMKIIIMKKKSKIK